MWACADIVQELGAHTPFVFISRPIVSERSADYVHGYDWLSGGSNSEYVWDDESDESDGGWPTWY